MCIAMSSARLTIIRLSGVSFTCRASTSGATTSLKYYSTASGSILAWQIIQTGKLYYNQITASALIDSSQILYLYSNHWRDASLCPEKNYFMNNTD